MKRVGAHVSVKGGVENAPLNAARIGAKAFALFTRNQRQWNTRALDTESLDRFKENCKREGFSASHILPHDIYLINLGSPEPAVLKRSRCGFIEELSRCRLLGLRFLNFHPGSHKGKTSDEACLSQIAGFLNKALSQVPDVIVVVENTCGAGGSVGHCFEHLAYLIERVNPKERVGVCLDTCHLFAAGYDLRSPKSYRDTMEEFDRMVGFEYLKGMHLNDSLGGMGSKLDRHRSLGEGQLTLEPFRLIMNDPRLEEIPLILETPHPERWVQEIEMLYGFVE
jgi:deoxyribonuclease-4